MSEKLQEAVNPEEVVAYITPIEEVVEEKKVLGTFKKSTLIKVGVGAAVLAGGLFILSKAKNYDVVTDIIESVEE
ncbi:MAG: hypothetical protein [Caudoviricetes sp.]|nr:MAG: hypothetical protein [Caudoviricetes sp.]